MTEEKKVKKKRRSKEEIFLDNKAKEQRKADRLEKKKERERIKEEKRIARENPPSEKELVNRYVNRVMNNQRNHGRVDSEKFNDLAYDKKVNKNIWMDEDFYFSVVFQSSEQKYAFLDEIGFTEDEASLAISNGKVKIINGLEFAKKLKIKLKEEIMSEYPTASIDLLPYILDTSTLKAKE